MKLLWIAPPDVADGSRLGLDRLNLSAIDVTHDPLDGLRRMRDSVYAVLLATVPLRNWTPEELIEEAHRANSGVPVLVHFPEASVADAVRLTKLGALNVLGPGTTDENLRAVIETAIAYRHSQDLSQLSESVKDEGWRRLLVGDSRSMRNVAETIRLVGSRRCTVLITGETGTGKEMVARALHLAGPRAQQQLVCVNCSALPEDLLEAELFGHVKGAFTGAVQHRTGRFEQAHRGTLFLDEIGDMPMEMQAKLLRVLQEREFQKVGSSDTVKVDVRMIAATNVDLVKRVEEGRFREDLYYRLNVVPVRIPPLRDRPKDIPLLVHHFLEKVCRQEEIPTRRVTPETLDRLCSFHWPGNVRQLENAIEMAIALSGDRLVLYPGDFPLPSISRLKPVPAGATLVSVPDDGLDFEQTVNGIERHILEQALRKTQGNKKLAADMLRLKRTTLSAKLKSLEVSERAATQAR